LRQWHGRIFFLYRFFPFVVGCDFLDGSVVD
jgi:hypothetical protein